jgi:hypothetical protein
MLVAESPAAILGDRLFKQLRMNPFWLGMADSCLLWGNLPHVEIGVLHFDRSLAMGG